VTHHRNQTTDPPQRHRVQIVPEWQGLFFQPVEWIEADQLVLLPETTNNQ
jgi:hypothetical protein